MATGTQNARPSLHGRSHSSASLQLTKKLTCGSHNLQAPQDTTTHGGLQCLKAAYASGMQADRVLGSDTMVSELTPWLHCVRAP